LDKRELALKHELYLFTNGKHKLAIKPTNDANSAKMKGAKTKCNNVSANDETTKRSSKKLSKKGSKKYQERPSPAVSAQDYPNKTMRGNDGNKWKSKPNVKGIYRWKKVD